MSTTKSSFVFGKKNYTVIAIGFAIVIIGFMLMSGGKSPSPDLFDKAEIFSDRRITYAPITVLLGFLIIGFGIMVKSESDDEPEVVLENKDQTVIDD